MMDHSIFHVPGKIITLSQNQVVNIQFLNLAQLGSDSLQCSIKATSNATSKKIPPSGK